MSNQSVTCPACQNCISVKKEWLGLELQCPTCNASFVYTANLQNESPFAPTPLDQSMLHRRPVKKVHLNYNGDGEWPDIFENIAPPITMVTAIKNYADFYGRASRTEYWLHTLLMFLVMFFGYILILIGFMGSTAFGIFLILMLVVFFFATIVPTVAVTVRRLHDINMPGLWIMLNLIPCVGPFIVMALACLPSHKAANCWGPDPNAKKIDELWPCLVTIAVMLLAPIILIIVGAIVGMGALFFLG